VQADRGTEPSTLMGSGNTKPPRSAAGGIERNRKFVDSLLEGDGFELLVRERGASGCRACLPWTGRRALFVDRFYRVPDRRLRVRQSWWPGRSAGCRPVPSNRARQKRDNQMHRARVLEVRIHLPPAVSPRTTGPRQRAFVERSRQRSINPIATSLTQIIPVAGEPSNIDGMLRDRS
jgi:hypothetical protein